MLVLQGMLILFIFYVWDVIDYGCTFNHVCDGLLHLLDVILSA